MKTKTVTKLDQLFQAINGARKTGHLMYAFHQKGRWRHSHRLPCKAIEYYIAYPSGHSDRSTIAQEVTPDDWNAYWHAHGGKSAFVLPRIAGRRAAQIKTKEFNVMNGFKTYISMALAYLATMLHLK